MARWRRPQLRGGDPAGEVGPDRGDAAVEVGQGAGVVDHHVSHGETLLTAGLRSSSGGLLWQKANDATRQKKQRKNLRMRGSSRGLQILVGQEFEVNVC